MKKLLWQIIVVLLALVAIGVLLLSQQPTSTSSLQEGEKPVEGGIYTEALVGSFGRLNPVLDAYNSTDFDIDRLIFSGLVQHDSRGVPHGDLAETWGISQDGKSYSFAIRHATFHDGAPVTSGVAVPVGPGTHSVAETLLPGYAFAGFGGDCAADGTVTVA